MQPNKRRKLKYVRDKNTIKLQKMEELVGKLQRHDEGDFEGFMKLFLKEAKDLRKICPSAKSLIEIFDDGLDDDNSMDTE